MHQNKTSAVVRHSSCKPSVTVRLLRSLCLSISHSTYFIRARRLDSHGAALSPSHTARACPLTPLHRDTASTLRSPSLAASPQRCSPHPLSSLLASHHRRYAHARAALIPLRARSHACHGVRLRDTHSSHTLALPRRTAPRLAPSQCLSRSSHRYTCRFLSTLLVPLA